MLSRTAEGRLKSFYMGKLYPLIICALIFLGYAFGIEVFLLPVVVLIAGISFWVCDSVRPIFVPLCTFLFAFSNRNSLFGEVSSDYYITGWRIVVFVLLIIFVVISLGAFLARIRFFDKLLVRKTPLLFPLLLLSLAFMLNGVGSDKWVKGNLIYASFQVIAFLIVFLLFYHGFSDNESPEELGDYFSYVTMLISLILIGEMIILYLTSPNIIQDGQIMKAEIVFGWGVCNNAGFYISVLIPMNFYRAYRSKFSLIPFSIATATWGAAILTLSRNALICSTATYVACLVCFMFFGKKRMFFRYATLLAILCLGTTFLVHQETILTALNNYSVQGLGDSGRFEIWVQGLKSFLDAPLFGNGFHGGLATGNVTASFIPTMAHNTVVQLLYSMGIVGFFTYVFYRYRTVLLFVRRPSILKCMLGASMLVLIVGSLLDNFLFHIQPVFYYSIAMAIVCKCDYEEAPYRIFIKKRR